MEKSTKIGIGLFLIIVVGGYFTTNSSSNPTSDEESFREIVVDAKQFEFSQPVIEVKKGENIRIKINNLDTTHGIYIPDLKVSGNEVVEFTADKKGEFLYVCATMCGVGHHEMKGKIIVS